MATKYKPSDEYASLFERVRRRGMPEDLALYAAALDYLMDSTQDLNLLADKYSDMYFFIVCPNEIEELAGEMYARDQVMTNNTVGEGE